MTTHLNALLLGLSNERERLANATSQGEIALRTVWVGHLEREVEAEEKFIDKVEISDDELLQLLGD